MLDILQKMANYVRGNHAVEGREKLVFYHIQKCGGTTIFDSLKPFYNKSEICPLRDARLHRASADDVKPYLLFSGHYAPAVIRSLVARPFREAALFREPIERLLSEYYFFRSHKWHFVENVAKDFPDADAYRKGKLLRLEEYLNDQSPRLTDYMMKQLCFGFCDDPSTNVLFETAKQIISSLDLVGTLDQVDLFTRRLHEMAGVPRPLKKLHSMQFLKLHKEYRHCERIEKESLTPAVRDLLLDITEGDRRFYDIVRQTCDTD